MAIERQSASAGSRRRAYRRNLNSSLDDLGRRHLKTYWFTVAVGDHYTNLFADLNTSARLHGIQIACFGQAPAAMHSACERRDRASVGRAKKLKIEGILNAPSGYDRIVFLDADTLLVDPSGIDEVNGSLREPWGMGQVPHVAMAGGLGAVLRRRARLWKLLRSVGLDEFCPGGRNFGQEWNSGVIVGDRAFMDELAREWAIWWDLVLEVCDGQFCRDQISYKYAYAKVARRKYGFDTIPSAYNCCVQRLGYLRDAKILHSGRLWWLGRRRWERAKQHVLQGRYRTSRLW